MRAAGGLLVGISLLVGSAGQAETRTQTGVSEAHPVASGAVTAPASEACAFAGTAEPKRGPEAVPGLLLTDVRVGTHGCYERVVFEVRPRGGEPASPLGYRVAYEPGPITQDGSGHPVAVDGAAFLVVTLQATGVDLSQDGAPETYTGPASIRTAGTTRIAEVRRSGDFEGISTWVIGLDATRPFRVGVAEAPVRLIVDVGD